MKYKDFSKIICSIPAILIVLYFIPFLGIVLIIFRYYMKRDMRPHKTSISLVICGIALLIPKIVELVSKTIKYNIEKIPYLNMVLVSDTYIKLLGYSKLLITLGIILFIIEIVFRNTFYKIKNQINSGVNEYIKNEQKKDYEISKKNDLIIKEKQERAKNTHVVKCPYCGASNIFTEKAGTCKFCRREIG